MFGDQLAAAPAEIRREVARLLDEISRPLTLGEIESALRAAGTTRSQRISIRKALRGFSIVAIVDDGALHSTERS